MPRPRLLYPTQTRKPCARFSMPKAPRLICPRPKSAVCSSCRRRKNCGRCNAVSRNWTPHTRALHPRGWSWWTIPVPTILMCSCGAIRTVPARKCRGSYWPSSPARTGSRSRRAADDSNSPGPSAAQTTRSPRACWSIASGCIISGRAWSAHRVILVCGPTRRHILNCSIISPPASWMRGGP